MGGNLEKNANVTNAISKWIYVGSFIQIGLWKSVEKIGGVVLKDGEFGGMGAIYDNI